MGGKLQFLRSSPLPSLEPLQRIIYRMNLFFTREKRNEPPNCQSAFFVVRRCPSKSTYKTEIPFSDNLLLKDTEQKNGISFSEPPFEGLHAFLPSGFPFALQLPVLLIPRIGLAPTSHQISCSSR